MNKTELISHLAEKNDLEVTVVEKLINSLEETVIEKLKAGEDVAITGFGTFSAKFRSARMGVNPRNPSEKIQIKAVTVPKFKAGKTFKDALKHKDDVQVEPKLEAPVVEESKPVEESPVVKENKSEETV